MEKAIKVIGTVFIIGAAIFIFYANAYDNSVDSSSTPPEDTQEAVDTLAETCIPSGDQSAIQTALTGEGSKAILCQGAEFHIEETITFTAPDQEILTAGLPTGDLRAILTISGIHVEVAVAGTNLSGVKLRHVIIDGSGELLGSGAMGLIQFGGMAQDQLVEYVKAFDPRGQSILVLDEGHELSCSGAIARFNELGPGGHPEPAISNGISLACRNSTVTNNIITDTTDGGIVILQAPGSLVANNTIISDERQMYYGISMVDSGPHEGDFTDTVVEGNTLDARGALMRHGIHMGPRVGCIPEKEDMIVSFGATVEDNLLTGSHMGYGYVVAGVADWTVTGNRDDSTREVVTGIPKDCFGKEADVVSSFMKNPNHSEGDFQNEFVDGVLTFSTGFWP